MPSRRCEMENVEKDYADRLVAAAWSAATAFRMRDEVALVDALRKLCAVVDRVVEQDDDGVDPEHDDEQG
jgi:hypothetical protein